MGANFDLCGMEWNLLITLPEDSDIDACEYQVVLDETYISLKKLNLILQENFKSQ